MKRKARIRKTPSVSPAAKIGAKPAAASIHPLVAGDIMRTDVITIDQSAPLSEVERVLVENRISGAPVTDETGAIVGVVSIRDLVERYAEDPDARPRRGRGWFQIDTDVLDEDDMVGSSEIPEEAEETARDVMTAEVYSVPEDAGIRDIARLMHAHHIHRVLVEADGMYVGLLSTMDLLGAIGERRRATRKAAPRGGRPTSTAKTSTSKKGPRR
ncbi:MAG TPA: CBS domain-containing protein [Planctomycetota bacterium]|nr:CBS domain-containing protein [Planctomycetota bacterium]